jgi:hypothetical protein
MGNEKHQSTEATNLNYFGRSQLFHIVSDDFPLPEDGIIGLPFLQKYDRYAVTPNFLIIENKKVPLHNDGQFINKNLGKACKIHVDSKDQDIWIGEHDLIPEGIYCIRNNEVKVPLTTIRTNR